jgi:membrane protein DedA with SNARE-associated domain
MRYRVFFINNLVSGIAWGVGYSLLGYLAGSAYATVERTVGVGLAIVAVVVVLALVTTFAWRRHRLLLRQVAESSDEGR